jgi:uncharacterized protein (TIGR04551 family)
MARTLLAMVLALSATAFAQADGGASESPSASGDVDALKRDFDAKLDAARREVKELRQEMNAQLANQVAAGGGWQEDWVNDRRKLELVTLDGYLRVRPELFDKFDLGRGEDPAGYSMWPRSSTAASERTNAGVNMRFRLDPTINVSEKVRIRAQVDALDNLVWGTTPDYAFSRNAANGYWYDLNDFSLFSNSQAPLRSGINSLQDSIALKRVWGEVSTPIGLLRFGRMGSHWGLGMLYNDGNGIDNDRGDTVDRISFTAEPLAGFYITPMLDFNVEGRTSVRMPEGGQPYDLSNLDDTQSFILAAARRDTESERLNKLNAGQGVFNYGVHFTYRTQNADAVDYLSQVFGNEGTNASQPSADWVRRKANIFIPDLWAKFEMKDFRIEAEVAAILGSIENRALSGADANAPGRNQSLYVYQFGGVLQGEYRFLNGDLEIGAEVGFASGDKAAGFGNHPRRKGSGAEGSTAPGDVEGPQYQCNSSGGCTDNEITNFRFNPDYRVDMILYRELLGRVTDSLYIKPRANYRITQGFDIFAGVIYSRALFISSTPGVLVSGSDPNLGIELNGGVRYETEDGFFAQVQYGILFPLNGFMKRDIGNQPVTLDFAQAVRGSLGIRF